MKKAELLQEHEPVVPHVLAVARGTTVDFSNGGSNLSQRVLVVWRRHLRYRPLSAGPESSAENDDAGIVKVFCRIHSQMSATILVFDHPYFTIPQENGSFELARVPPGSYTIVRWHEPVGERTATVRVERGRATTIDLSLSVEDPR